jgi:hypothetical protein
VLVRQRRSASVALAQRHCHVESFSALLELLDNQRLARGIPPERETLAQVMVRRLKSELPLDDFGQPRFPERRLEAIEVAYDEERAIHNKLQPYMRLRHRPAIYHFVPAGYEDSAPAAAQARLADPFGSTTLAPAQPPGALEWDMEFLMLAVRKVEQIRQDLGKVGPVIADQVTEAMLGRRERLQTAEAEREAAPVRQMLRFERDLHARIHQLHEQLQETKRELQLSPENIQAVVEIALELAGQPRLQEAELPGIWPDVVDFIELQYASCPTIS